MLEKALIFGVGYLLGAKAGRERYHEIMRALGGLAERRELATVVSLVQGFVEERMAA